MCNCVIVVTDSKYSNNLIATRGRRATVIAIAAIIAISTLTITAVITAISAVITVAFTVVPATVIIPGARTGAGAASRNVTVAVARRFTVTAASTWTETIFPITTNLRNRFAVVESRGGVVGRLGLGKIDPNFTLIHFQAVGLETGNFRVLLALKVNEPKAL